MRILISRSRFRAQHVKEQKSAYRGEGEEVKRPHVILGRLELIKLPSLVQYLGKRVSIGFRSSLQYVVKEIKGEMLIPGARNLQQSIREVARFQTLQILDTLTHALNAARMQGL